MPNIEIVNKCSFSCPNIINIINQINNEKEQIEIYSKNNGYKEFKILINKILSIKVVPNIIKFNEFNIKIIFNLNELFGKRMNDKNFLLSFMNDINSCHINCFDKLIKEIVFLMTKDETNNDINFLYFTFFDSFDNREFFIELLSCHSFDDNNPEWFVNLVNILNCKELYYEIVNNFLYGVQKYLDFKFKNIWMNLFHNDSITTISEYYRFLYNIEGCYRYDELSQNAILITTYLDKYIQDETGNEITHQKCKEYVFKYFNDLKEYIFKEIRRNY